ncbi:DUF5133 domain-containing protein [Streptomyces sp. NPDC090131]|uniref:DUF5133 domain-containing protein n=1 Tax=Streptomyces sp. NPDC090131 TaxID=3365954 RepID=UPI00380CC50B
MRAGELAAVRVRLEEFTSEVFAPLVRRDWLASRVRTEEALRRLWECRARLVMAPEDIAAQRAMGDAAYTLCVLMGSPTAREAVIVAQRRLAVPAP